MAQHLPFVTLDVFTSKPYSGNPVAAVFLPEKSKSASITQTQKQRIAREFNLSETIFIHQGNGAKRTIDIFTKTCEIPFAGHPTIGAAAWHLCHSTEQDKKTVRVLLTKSGEIPISLQSGNSNVVSAKIAHDVRVHAARFPLSEVLRLHPSLAPFFPTDEAGESSISFPVVSIVNGMSQVHIKLPTLTALSAVTTAAGGEVIQVNSGYQDEGWENGICVQYFFVRDTDSCNDRKTVLRTRGVRGNLEDPATGSAASGLAAYLTLQDGGEGKFEYHFRQGVEMGRPSEIRVGVVVKEGQIDSVELKGTAVKVSEGRILVPDA
ncbi:hypothetical protein ASPWEDRAFT_588928 [Aspergillus wentii DTO 134E9]|uniref:Phenazine biosynthesis protein n=1 Tax=Aspergillus wentii DTO 134E9 TaxID=1073089 RepID=A0A1L9RCM5_ASPWE|nr:uncharacterized protein ASPWEDRAFT_588928 [Aspergillus wentii DTO 134E9]KAI9924245.1 hypothetical protein MW887_007195 [Aspergillus wentii]OJJ32661.1 hypothetical protein ASPWEDRAFT_588928 [Aspergillus wentii DTO 134E9]